MVQHRRVAVDCRMLSLNGQCPLDRTRPRWSFKHSAARQLHIAWANVDVEHRTAILMLSEHIGARRNRRSLPLLPGHAGEPANQIQGGSERLIEVGEPMIAVSANLT